MIKYVLTLSLLIISSLTFVGCNPSSDKTTEEAIAPDVSEYKVASCLYQFEEGEAASPSNRSSVQSTHFKKRYDQQLLQSVLSASSAEVIRFAETTGVTFYKTSRRFNDSCELLSSLPASPSDLSGEFNRANKSGTVLGLYLGQRTENLASTNNSAAIIVRSDVNKWVLVHEFLHHLFQVQAERDGIKVNELRTELLNQLEVYESTKKAISGSGEAREQKLNQAAVELQKLHNVGIQFVRQYSLEEMTIESMMAKDFKSNALTFVHSKQRLNGAAYTISSATKATEIQNIFKREVELFDMLYSWELETEPKEKVKKMKFDYTEIASEMAGLVSKAKAVLQEEGLEYREYKNLMGFAKHDEPHADCSHDQVTNELLKDLRNR